MKYRISILLAFLGFFAQAQERLTLKDAVNYALQNKVEAVKARLEIENSEYKIDEVRANALPKITADAGLTYNPIIQQMALVIGDQVQVIQMGQPWQSNAMVSLNQQIFNQAVFTGLKAAKTTREFYKINADLTDEQVIEKVANSYFEAYKTESKLKTIEKTIENTSRVREVIKSLYDNGLAKKIDLDRIDVTLNNLKSNRQQAINALELQENTLKYLIGMDMNQDIEMPENTFEVTKHALVDDSVNIENRTEIKLLEKRSELLTLNKKAITAEGYPSLSMTANFGYVGFGQTLPWFAKPADGVFWSSTSAVGLNLSIPIFNGGSVKAKAKQAQVEIDKVEAEKRDTRLSLDMSLKNAVTQLNNSLITLNVQKENVTLAKEVLTDIENNYKFGLATLTDLLDAETSYADAQNSHTNALLDYKVAEIQLIKAKGELKSLTEE